jgi:hypothetical protein
MRHRAVLHMPGRTDVLDSLKEKLVRSTQPNALPSADIYVSPCGMIMGPCRQQAGTVIAAFAWGVRSLGCGRDNCGCEGTASAASPAVCEG